MLIRALGFTSTLFLSCYTFPFSLLTPKESNLQSVLSPASADPSIAGLLRQPILANPKNKLEFKETNWVEGGTHFVEQDGIVYESVVYPEFPEHRLRLRSPQLCDDALQYSGYLDVKEGAHSLFFWFFESRAKPAEDPLVLWLNGGPGCSSSTGLLFELGPCTVTDEGRNTSFNKYSWTSNANIIFLDQPVTVGYSYARDGSTVNTTPVAAVDVWAFLEMFLARHPKYVKAPFHIAAESYGGIYAPNIASVIHKKNKELSFTLDSSRQHINLDSVIIGNGLTDPLIQFPAIPDFACGGPYPVFEPGSFQCSALYSKSSTCERLIKACYSFNSRLTCVPAALYCWSQMYGSFQTLGLNPYDVRKKCDRIADGPLCYKQMGWIEVYMNQPHVKAELGANENVEFQSCNEEVTRAFLSQGDSMHNTAALLPELLADGIRMLVYAGNADFMCNFMGNEAWMEKLDSPFKANFSAAEDIEWTINGKPVGKVRSAGATASSGGNYTFVRVFESGHMVPYDQPEAALVMFNRWLQGKPIIDSE